MYTSNEYQFCDEQVKAGCKTSSELERLLWKKYPLMTKTEAYRLVRRWIHDREKIENGNSVNLNTKEYIINQNNIQNEAHNEQHNN
jgi:hypothetical protein